MTNSETAKKHIPEIIQLVNLNDITGVKQLLLSGSAKIEDVDESGMTPLQHACYKGQLEMTKLLLQYGADVNSDNHSHAYSCLHFAALSANLDVVKTVLCAGAKTYHTNSLKRTASQMAGFVGNHQIVSLINNFVPVDAIQYYTKVQGLETQPKLAAQLVSPLYNIVMQPNLHPVSIAMNVERSPELLMDDHLLQCSQVLSLMSEKEAKRSENVNEVLCLKLHYLSYVLATLSKESKKETKCEDGLLFETLIKKWLIGRAKDGFETHLDYYVRDAIKAFTYAEMPLFVQLCRNIASNTDQIWTLDVLSGFINGQKGFDDHLSCAACGAEKEEAKKCSKCKSVQYCDRTCQRLQWHTHKKFCQQMHQNFLKKKKREEEEEALAQDKELIERLQGLKTEIPKSDTN